MNMRYDIELLKKRLGYLEENMAEVKQRIARLEAEAEHETPPNPVPKEAIHPEDIQETTTPLATPSAAPLSSDEPPPLPPIRPAMHQNAETPGTPQNEPSLIPPPPPPLPQPTTVSIAQTSSDPDPLAATTMPEPKWTRPPPPPPPDEPPAWKPWLQKIHLWPPSAGDAAKSGENNTEVRLAAWWTTRVGMALLILGIVFLGVYFSINANPVIKFVELLAISLGITAGGLWLERKIPKFGAVVFGGGLALLYFCAFASHAIPAVKVVESPVLATLWQLAAAAAMGGAALWRRSPIIATMATALAVVSAIFAQVRGLPDFALVTSALLAAGGVVLHRWKHWEGPSVVAMPGAYAVYALVLAGTWLRELRMTGRVPAAADGAWPWVFLVAMLLLHFARDWRGKQDDMGKIGYGERFFQGLNSSLALALGFVTAFTLQSDHLAAFYFTAAAVIGVLVVLRQWQMPGDIVAAILAAKATGVLALGLIEIGDGRTTAIQLLIQSWVTLLIARRMCSKFLAACAMLIALTAYGFFLRHAIGGIDIISIHALGALFFVMGFSLLPKGVRGVTSRPGLVSEVIIAMLSAVAAAIAVSFLSPPGWGPAAFMTFAIVGMATAKFCRNSGSAIMGGVLALAAHAALCLGIWAGADTLGAHLVANALAVAAPTIAAGVVLVRKTQNRTPIAQLAPWLWALTLFSGAQVLFELFNEHIALAIMSGIALALAASAPWAGARAHLATLATWTVVLGAGCWLRMRFFDTPASSWWLAGSAVVLWSIPTLLRGSARHDAIRNATSPSASLEEWLQAACALIVSFRATQLIIAGIGLAWLTPLAFAIVALAVASLAWRPGVIPALAASWVAWLAALYPIVTHRFHSEENVSIPEYIVACATALLVWAPAWWSTRFAFPSRRWRAAIGPVHATLGVVAAWFLALNYFRAPETLLVLVIAILFVALALRLWKVTAARWAMLALGAGTWGYAFSRASAGWVQGMSPESGLLVLLAALIVALPWLAGEGPKPLSTAAQTRLRWLAGAMGLFLMFFAAWKQHCTLTPYITVIWGLSAIALFMSGLLARVRPYRLLGLAGLALCVPRMFFVDLHSALYRIAAFVVLGLVLLWVGFSYHKFRHLIVEEKSKTPNDVK